MDYYHYYHYYYYYYYYYYKGTMVCKDSPRRRVGNEKKTLPCSGMFIIIEWIQLEKNRNVIMQAQLC